MSTFLTEFQNKIFPNKKNIMPRENSGFGCEHMFHTVSIISETHLQMEQQCASNVTRFLNSLKEFPVQFFLTKVGPFFFCVF